MFGGYERVEQFLCSAFANAELGGPFLDGAESADTRGGEDSPLEVFLRDFFFRVEFEAFAAGEDQRPRVADGQVAVAVFEDA